MTKNTQHLTAPRAVGRPRHPEPLTRLVVTVESSTLDRLHEIANAEDRSLSSIARRALTREVAQHPEAA